MRIIYTESQVLPVSQNSAPCDISELSKATSLWSLHLKGGDPISPELAKCLVVNWPSIWSVTEVPELQAEILVDGKVILDTYVNDADFNARLHLLEAAEGLEEEEYDRIKELSNHIDSVRFYL